MTVEVKICPRCGGEYKYVEKRVIKSQTYYYALHITKDEDGRKHVHKCYLGAQQYIYVKRVHQDSNINFHGYVVQDRYQKYAKCVKDYLNRDKKYNKSRKTVQAEIEPFVKKIYSQAKWKVSIIALNALYRKYLAYALDMGMGVDQYNNIFGALDPSLTYSELESELSMRLQADFHENFF